jgi:hypothetical protein
VSNDKLANDKLANDKLANDKLSELRSSVWNGMLQNGRTPTFSSEAQLTDALEAVLQGLGCRIIKREWDVQPGMPHHGKGDLVVEVDPSLHLTIEVKLLRSQACQWTKLRRVMVQAILYWGAYITSIKRDLKVACTYYTNKDGLQLLE